MSNNTDKVFAEGIFIYEKQSNYGSFFSVDITQDFIDFFNKNKIDGYQGKDKIRVNIFKKQTQEDKKPTHYMVLNNPTNQQTNTNPPQNPALSNIPKSSNIPNPVSDNKENDDLPF